MAIRTRMRMLSYLALLATPWLSGCATVPIAVAGVGSGISFTSTTAYRSFTYSKSQVYKATLQALAHMQIKKIKEEKDGEDIQIMGKTKNLKIYITLESVTPMVTKAAINAKKNWFMKDQTVAAEILIQMDNLLKPIDPVNAPH